MLSFISPEDVADKTTRELFEFLLSNSAALDLKDALFHCDFPIYKDADGDVVPVKALLVSKAHGVIVFGTCDVTNKEDIEEIHKSSTELEHAFSNLYSKLLKNRQLRKNKTSLLFNTSAALYAPLLADKPLMNDIDVEIVLNEKQLTAMITELTGSPIDADIYDEILATIEGSKALERPKSRQLEGTAINSKGRQAFLVESEIAKFDRQQRRSYAKPIDGPQRIRGLAGSGKTVVLAMKAALTHLRNPEATIVYTFYTKSLYQHIQRLITRFCRQFDDRDPDWSKLKVMHAWGGQANPGVYHQVCKHHEQPPITFTDAHSLSANPFEYVCKELLKRVQPQPMYDFVFVDEGQDFPATFLRLCHSISKGGKFIWAYDELQTIFQAKAPSAQEIFGQDKDGKSLVELSEDIVLSTCYRNPRELLICAHAIGFGLYRGKPVQMMENREHWEDIGYKFISGDFSQGQMLVLERPEENSLTIISDKSGTDEIIKVACFDTAVDEVNGVVESISEDIKDGLRADDILVITADDRNAKYYLGLLGKALTDVNIQSYNVHALSYGLPEFHRENFVTLSTVHKAKGNEAFMVYILGVDACFDPDTVRNRNKLFTAMTRAKGWVRLTGVGEPTKKLQAEILAAKAKSPRLEFVYPNHSDLQIMRRDLEESAIPKARAEKLLEDALWQVRADMSEDEIDEFIREYTQGGRKRKQFEIDKKD
jgi:superfamily I DNA and RNA helicase